MLLRHETGRYSYEPWSEESLTSSVEPDPRVATGFGLHGNPFDELCGDSDERARNGWMCLQKLKDCKPFGVTFRAW